MGMKSKHTDTETKTAYSKPLPTPVKFSFDWTEYETAADMRSANDALSDDEQVKVRNVERKTKARQAALSAALTAAGIVKPDIENDEQLRLREMFKVLMSSKRYTEEAARAKASEDLGIEWDED